MRTTFTLDEDVHAKLNLVVREPGQPFMAAVKLPDVHVLLRALNSSAAHPASAHAALRRVELKGP